MNGERSQGLYSSDELQAFLKDKARGLVGKFAPSHLSPDHYISIRRSIHQDPTELVHSLGDVVNGFTDFNNKGESVEIFCPGLTETDRESIKWFSDALTSSLEHLAGYWRDAPLKIEPYGLD